MHGPINIRYIQCFVGGVEGTRSLMRLRRRWEDDIKMCLQEIGLMRERDCCGLI